ncbi:uncharacterized protein LOC143448569 [Clavelina lepadiformis]|uniref:uncharacterized protein LOC143448569 n=1 Tax=Clavelina lepadiformis TaxID=159417 RepID=UPI004042F7B0
MEVGGSSKHDSLWLQGTRRNTRSSSNHEKEAKEKVAPALAETKSQQDNGVDAVDLKKKDSTGHIVRGQNNEVTEYVSEDGVSYKLFDSAYVATERTDNPYAIGTIQEIKVSKKDLAVMVVKWYYRPAEVPDLVYQMLVKERLDGIDDQKERETILNGDNRNRELFVADDDVMEMFPVSTLRGKCSVKHFKNFLEVKGYNLKPDSFFYVLGYNPETRRLSSVHGEVRVGPSHQWAATTRGIFQKAILPEVLLTKQKSEEKVNLDYEELIWEPKVKDCDLMMYLQSARSMAAFAGMCDGGSPEEGCVIASRDDTTINALNILFQCNGDARAALQVLVKKPLPMTIERKWTEDQLKRFQKGLRQNGKNFFKIKKDQLPNKETSEIVEFYYLWKKVQEGLVVQPQSKNRRQATMKRGSKSATTANEAGVSSSDIESESEESDKEPLKFTCKHCQTTTSEDWHVGGKESVMLCTECRIIFKKYGEDKHVALDFQDDVKADLDKDSCPTSLSPIFNEPVAESQPHPFLFKPIKEKMSIDAQEPAAPDDDNTDGEDVKKPIKRQWEPDTNENQIDEKRIKAEIKGERTQFSPVPAKSPEVSQTNSSSVPWKNRLDDDLKTVKQEPETSVKPPLSLDDMHYPPYRVRAMFPGQPHMLPTAHPSPHAASSKRGETKGSGKPPSPQKTSSNVTEVTKAETPVSVPASYPRHPFYPPRIPFVPGHPPGSSGDARYPVPPHLYGWPTVPPPSSNQEKNLHAKLSNPQSSEPHLKRSNHTPPQNVSRNSPKPTTEAPPPPLKGSNYPPTSTLEYARPPAQVHRRGDLATNEVPIKTEPVKESVSPSSGHVQKTSRQLSASSSSAVAENEKKANREQVAPTPTNEDDDSGGEEPSPPIYPEHHVTIPAGKPWPQNFRFYDDGLPRQDRSKGKVVCFAGQKIRLEGCPGSFCSRTDFTLVSTKVKKEPHKPDNRHVQAQPVTSQPQRAQPYKPPPEREREREKERERPKPREERPQSSHYPTEPVAIKREVPRPQLRQPQPQNAPHHTPHTVARATPTHRTTPTPGFDPHRPPPARSSPYGTLGPDTPALRTLRQYATIDSQREAMNSMMTPHAQSLLSFHAAQSERDLRERELRERELRERMPKQTLDNGKLMDPLDPQMAALAMRGLHPAMVPGLVNQQALEQMRQQPYPGAMLGVPGAPPIVPGAIPGFPHLLAQHPELQLQHCAAERLANESRLHAAERAAALEHQYRMELLHNHQHSHVHSHVHLHPQNVPPPGGAVVPPSVAINDPVMNQYTALAHQALAVQQQHAALAAGLDPMQAASMNQMLSLQGVRGPHAIMPPPGVPGVPIVPHGLPPSRPAELHHFLSASQQLQVAAAHEQSLIEQQRFHDEYVARMSVPGHKP